MKTKNGIIISTIQKIKQLENHNNLGSSSNIHEAGEDSLLRI